MLNTIVFFTYLDVCTRLSISDSRLLSERRTTLIGKRAHLAMISSPGEVSIWMNIWEMFTPVDHLQLCQCERFVSRTEISVKSVDKFELDCSEIRKSVVRWNELFVYELSLHVLWNLQIKFHAILYGWFINIYWGGQSIFEQIHISTHLHCCVIPFGKVLKPCCLITTFLCSYAVYVWINGRSCLRCLRVDQRELLSALSTCGSAGAPVCAVYVWISGSSYLRCLRMD